MCAHLLADENRCLHIPLDNLAFGVEGVLLTGRMQPCKSTFQWIRVSRHRHGTQDAYSSFFRLMKRVARKERPSGRLLDANSILCTSSGRPEGRG